MVSIGRAMAELGLTARALRHYSDEGLISAGRDRRNFRVFSQESYAELQLLARLRRAGLSLDQIRFVLEIGRREGRDVLERIASDFLQQRLDQLEAERGRVDAALQWVRTPSAGLRPQAGA